MSFRFAQRQFKELGCLGKELRFASPRRFAPTRLRLKQIATLTHEAKASFAIPAVLLLLALREKDYPLKPFGFTPCVCHHNLRSKQSHEVKALSRQTIVRQGTKRDVKFAVNLTVYKNKKGNCSKPRGTHKLILRIR